MTVFLRLLLVSTIVFGTPTIAWSAPGDFDNDGIADAEDADSDNDGIPNINEGLDDTDFDGLPNWLDLDSDNDTIPDMIEAILDRGLLSRVDSDLNGQVDPGIQLGGNGLANILEVVDDATNIIYSIPDSDEDRVPNYLDLDSDNDGLSDRIEYRNIRELRLAQVTVIADPDGNGLDNSFPLLPGFFDEDGDGTENAIDTDSDQDGLSDLLETAGIERDRDNNGRIDQFLDINLNGYDDSLEGAPLQFVDVDSDGLPNHLDLDSDNDGAFDAQEASLPNVDGIFVNNQPPQDPPEDVDTVVSPTTNPTASTGTNTIVSSIDETTTSTVTTSSFDPIENPIRQAGTTIITGRDGSVYGGCTLVAGNNQRGPLAALEWMLLLAAALVFKLKSARYR